MGTVLCGHVLTGPAARPLSPSARSPRDQSGARRHSPLCCQWEKVAAVAAALGPGSCHPPKAVPLSHAGTISVLAVAVRVQQTTKCEAAYFIHFHSVTSRVRFSKVLALCPRLGIHDMHR